jgi:hypothetical protein
MPMKIKVIFRLVLGVVVISNLVLPAQVFAQGTGFSELPLIRGPGVSQEQLEAHAEAQGRSTLSDHLDAIRPGKENEQKLHKLVERAQTAWLSGSIEAARFTFKEIAHLALEADWREPQREAIHYAILRLAQTAPTPTERDEWIEKATTLFPDIQADTDNFPPPLMDSFRAARSRVLALAQTYIPSAHFPDHRYLLINGKRFVITSELKIRLTQGLHRVTALSDAYLPMTEKLTSSQMEVFRLSMPPLASGTCDLPSAGASNSEAVSFTVVYSTDCIRSKTAQGWIAKDSEGFAKGDVAFKNSERSSAGLENDVLSQISGAAPSQSASTSNKHSWIWAGAAALTAGTIYLVQRQMNHEPSSSPRAEPVHRSGF